MMEGVADAIATAESKEEVDQLIEVGNVLLPERP